MRGTSVLLQVFKTPRAKIVRSGMVGFSIGCLSAGLLTLGLIDIEERQRRWNKDVLEMSQSIRRLEDHVKILEQKNP